MPSSVMEVLIGVALVAAAQAVVLHGSAMLGIKPAKQQPADEDRARSRKNDGRYSLGTSEITQREKHSLGRSSQNEGSRLGSFALIVLVDAADCAIYKGPSAY